MPVWRKCFKRDGALILGLQASRSLSVDMPAMVEVASQPEAFCLCVCCSATDSCFCEELGIYGSCLDNCWQEEKAQSTEQGEFYLFPGDKFIKQPCVYRNPHRSGGESSPNCTLPAICIFHHCNWKVFSIFPLGMFAYTQAHTYVLVY